MVFETAIIVGVVCAFVSLRKRFYSMWPVLFNVLVSVYLAVMLTPFLVDLIPEVSSLAVRARYYAATMVIIALLVFLILQVVAIKVFTSEVTISFPSMFDGIGSVVLGFLAGYITVAFVFFVVSIMPLAQKPFMKKIVKAKTFELATVDSITRACDIVALVSLHHDNNVSEVISQLNILKTEPELKIEVKPPPKSIQSDKRFDNPDSIEKN